MLAFGLVEPAAFALILFLTAGTFNYWQAWVFLVVFALSGWIPSLYLMRTNPVALQRRIRGGPTAESRTTQKIVMTGTWLSLAAMLAVSGLDRRFGWSSVPTAICLGGAVLVAVGQVVMIQTVDMNAIQLGCCAAIGGDVEAEPDGLTLQELHFPPDTP